MSEIQEEKLRKKRIEKVFFMLRIIKLPNIWQIGFYRNYCNQTSFTAHFISQAIMLRST